MEKVNIVIISEFLMFSFIFIGKVHQRYVRNPAKDPLLLMEGKLPDYSDEQYIPVPAKIGNWLFLVDRELKRVYN